MDTDTRQTPDIGSPVSGITVDFHGLELVLDRSGVAYVPSERAVLVADLHFEKATALMRGGLFLPPYDTHETLAKLAAAISRFAPRRVICLGDSFHDVDAATRLSADARQSLTELSRRRDWVWLSGNHDPSPAGFDVAAELRLERVILRHEPRFDRPEPQIAGHLHPCARIVQRGRSLRRRCFAQAKHHLILPAFGALTGSLNVCDDAFCNLMRHADARAYLLGTTTVHPISGRRLLPD